MLAIIIEHRLRLRASVSLQQEGCHFVEKGFDMRLAERVLRQDEIVLILRVEDVSESIALLEETEETVQVLQTHPTEEGRCHHFLSDELIEHGLLALHELHILGRNPVHHLLESQSERIFVAVAERCATEDGMQEPTVLELLRNYRQVGMVEVEGHEPVGHFIEEGEPLHLRETAEIDV